MTGSEMGVIAAQALAAGGNFTLAFFAFKAIRQTRETQRQQRKVGQLREVADWAVDVMGAPNKAPLLSLTPNLGKEREQEWETEVKKLAAPVYANIARELTLTGCRGEYIIKITEGIDKDLHSKVEETTRQVFSIRDHIVKEQFTRVGAESWSPVYDTAKQVVERVSELMGSL